MPESHGIYDFIHRDPATMKIYLSTSVTSDPDFYFDLGKWHIPLNSAKTQLLRKGTPFWENLERSGIHATVIDIPADYPPPPSSSEVLAGMGTPDLWGRTASPTYSPPMGRCSTDATRQRKSPRCHQRKTRPGRPGSPVPRIRT